jgi:predicted ArsR family transcriptional regulator
LAFGDELRNTSVVKKNEPDERTRDLVARAILEGGPASAALLAEKLALTPAGIRRHLDSLVLEGILTSRDPYQSEAHGGRGRPAKVFLMTDHGRERFEHSYDDLAVSALKFIAAQSTGGSVKGFAEQRAAEMENRARASVDQVDGIAEKSKVLADFLSEEGYASTVSTTALGEQLCQHHCPVAHVASAFPELCEAETQSLARLLGTHIQRLATIAHGDGVCTTFIPHIQESHNETSTIGAGA